MNRCLSPPIADVAGRSSFVIVADYDIGISISFLVIHDKNISLHRMKIKYDLDLVRFAAT